MSLQVLQTFLITFKISFWILLLSYKTKTTIQTKNDYRDLILPEGEKKSLLPTMLLLWWVKLFSSLREVSN